MPSESRPCQNCNQEFTIASEDFDFYATLKIPAPTFCPQCRLQRRLAQRNERSLYRRPCDLCKKSIISRYPEGTDFPVYCPPCWYSDKWDPLSYGQEYDFNKNFFEQWNELRHKVPYPSLMVTNATNSDYANQCLYVKNVYLSTSVLHSEDIYYGYSIDKSKELFDIAFAWEAQRCYDSLDLEQANGVMFSRYVQSCLDSAFLYDVNASNNCFACVNRRNASYEILNEKYAKEDYKTERAKYDTGDYETLNKIKSDFEIFHAKFPKRYAMLLQSVNVVGDNVQNAKNAYWCFDSNNVEDSKYILRGTQGVKNCYDLNHSGVNAQYCCDSWSTMGNNNKFCVAAYGQHTEYSEFCLNSAISNVFGCVSFTSRKEYCILNKQYSKEEYVALREKIVKHMNDTPYVDSKGRLYRYGEFMPVELSHHAYNETLAFDYFPLTKDAALDKGYRWKEEEKGRNVPTLQAKDLPAHIKDATEDMTKEAIGCEHAGNCDERCSEAFRILPEELAFYKQMNIALPRLCPNCRHYGRLKKRNPLKLYPRHCMCAGLVAQGGEYHNTSAHPHGPQPCPNEFQTTYGPAQPDIVYCDQCYQAEVV